MNYQFPIPKYAIFGNHKMCFGEILNTMSEYKLPSFQRGLVWSEEQKIRFCESIIMGIPLGSIMINESKNKDLDRLLLDGQQRLNAVKCWTDGEFPVMGLYWKDINRTTMFTLKLSRTIGIVSVKMDDISILKEVYDLHNFGGTAHTNSDRAKR